MRSSSPTTRGTASGRCSPGAQGDPDPSLRASFAEGASGPVDLQIGPGGDLFYVDMNGGKIRRIQSFSTNQAPVALIDSDVTGGPLPLVIQFDGTGSYDPEAGPGHLLLGPER